MSVYAVGTKEGTCVVLDNFRYIGLEFEDGEWQIVLELNNDDNSYILYRMSKEDNESKEEATKIWYDVVAEIAKARNRESKLSSASNILDIDRICERKVHLNGSR